MNIVSSQNHRATKSAASTFLVQEAGRPARGGSTRRQRWRRRWRWNLGQHGTIPFKGKRISIVQLIPWNRVPFNLNLVDLAHLTEIYFSSSMAEAAMGTATRTSLPNWAWERATGMAPEGSGAWCGASKTTAWSTPGVCAWRPMVRMNFGKNSWFLSIFRLYGYVLSILNVQLHDPVFLKLLRHKLWYDLAS